MLLVNSTPLAARLDIGAPLPNGLRRGMLVAKATYRFDGSGHAELETQAPYPIFLKDELTPHGFLPRDSVARLDDVFEVSLLGCAHAPQGRPAEHVRVSLAVGGKHQSLDVFGDRWFEGEGPGATISRPEPFVKMPLTWSRAFGGAADIELDEGAFIRVQHAGNSYGKGVDIHAEAKKLDEQLVCPSGYPKFERRRALPNVERSEQLIRGWDDNPEPVSFAPPPIETGAHNIRCFDVVEEPGKGKRAVPNDGVHHRAPAEWVLPAPPSEGTVIRMEGVSPDGAMEVHLPKLDVLFDYVLGERTGAREMKRQALVLLPEERRFYLVYRLPFQIETPNGVERTGRLRLGFDEPKERP